MASDYDRAFGQWVQATAPLLREKHWDDIDADILSADWLPNAQDDNRTTAE